MVLFPGTQKAEKEAIAERLEQYRASKESGIQGQEPMEEDIYAVDAEVGGTVSNKLSDGPVIICNKLSDWQVTMCNKPSDWQVRSQGYKARNPWRKIYMQWMQR